MASDFSHFYEIIEKDTKEAIENDGTSLSKYE